MTQTYNCYNNNNKTNLPDVREQPVSRTYQYRKVMKPMLERKRRARINRCLDELKEFMVAALQSEGENISKLEKADILELTVQHLHKLRQEEASAVHVPESSGFSAGFTSCAAEVSQYLRSTGCGVHPEATSNLLNHLGSCIRSIQCSGKTDVYSAPTPVWRPW